MPGHECSYISDSKLVNKTTLEGLKLKLKLQYFGQLMQRADSFEKTLILERLKVGEGDNKAWDGWMALPTQWTWVWVNSRSWWWSGRPGVLQSMGPQRVRHEWTDWQKTQHVRVHCVCIITTVSPKKWLLQASQKILFCHMQIFSHLNWFIWQYKWNVLKPGISQQHVLTDYILLQKKPSWNFR